MTELKTLKDLEIWKHSSLMAEELLKAEAVKWFKKLANDNFRKEVWQTFFNLTEEDLKESKE